MAMEDTFLRVEERYRWCEGYSWTDHSVSSRNPNHECLQVGLLARGSRRLKPSVRAPTFPSRNRPSGDLATASHLQWRDRAGFHTGLPCYAQMGTCKPEAPEWGKRVTHSDLFEIMGRIRVCQARVRAWMRSTRCRRLQTTRFDLSSGRIARCVQST